MASNRITASIGLQVPNTLVYGILDRLFASGRR